MEGKSGQSFWHAKFGYSCRWVFTSMNWLCSRALELNWHFLKFLIKMFKVQILPLLLLIIIKLIYIYIYIYIYKELVLWLYLQIKITKSLVFYLFIFFINFEKTTYNQDITFLFCCKNIILILTFWGYCQFGSN